jgi:hypothetical protein
MEVGVLVDVFSWPLSGDNCFQRSVSSPDSPQFPIASGTL